MTATTTSSPTRKHDDATTAGKTFAELGVEQSLVDALAEGGITHAFPIQELTLPLALGGADIIGQARTGTGKTFGFGLPLLSRIDVDKAQTQALVVLPTRELCIQVANDLEIGAARGVRVQSVYGGVGYDEQIEALTTGVHVVVGTPGRTIDHLNKGNLDLSGVHVVVLDEADEMLDMGFLPDVERLLKGCPDERQTLLFSATMPTAVVKLARRFMDKPTFMQADTEAHETAPNVDQWFFTVHRMDKPRVLARILQSPNRGGAFVFCRTKRMCDRLVDELDGLGVSAIAVHGDLRQSSRERNLDKMRDGSADVLVATEVAARGLDVSNVTHVINYDIPDDEKMYLHRIGRTARAGAAGVAVTFAEFNEAERANVIRKKVDADTEMHEVFSTSDELVEWFDLPAETPWAHLTKASRSSGSSKRSSSSGKGRSKQTAKRDDSRSTSTSRDDSSSSRSTQRDDRSADTSDDGSRESKSAARSPESDTTRERTRTRTRSRSRDDEASGSRSSSRDHRLEQEGRSRDDSGSKDRERDDSGGSKGRSRSSDSGRSSSGSDGGSSETPDVSGGARPRSRRKRSSSSSSSESSGSSSRSRSTAKDDGGRSRSGRDDSTGSSKRSSRDDTSRDRSGNRDRDGGRDRDSGRGSRSDRGSRGSSNNEPKVRTTKRGDDARGEGTPRHSRRVEVENLP